MIDVNRQVLGVERMNIDRLDFPLPTFLRVKASDLNMLGGLKIPNLSVRDLVVLLSGVVGHFRFELVQDFVRFDASPIRAPHAHQTTDQALVLQRTVGEEVANEVAGPIAFFA
jgi:hypothetical protein